jgi:hypothetical protein
VLGGAMVRGGTVIDAGGGVGIVFVEGLLRQEGVRQAVELFTVFPRSSRALS